MNLKQLTTYTTLGLSTLTGSANAQTPNIERYPHQKEAKRMAFFAYKIGFGRDRNNRTDFTIEGNTDFYARKEKYLIIGSCSDINVDGLPHDQCADLDAIIGKMTNGEAEGKATGSATDFGADLEVTIRIPDLTSKTRMTVIGIPSSNKRYFICDSLIIDGKTYPCK